VRQLLQGSRSLPASHPQASLSGANWEWGDNHQLLQSAARRCVQWQSRQLPAAMMHALIDLLADLGLAV
jgi:hypothetical protein